MDNKKRLLTRAIASGLIAMQLGTTLLPAAIQVSAVTPATSQGEYDTQLAAYRAKLAEYETKKAEYDRLKAEYDAKVKERDAIIAQNAANNGGAREAKSREQAKAFTDFIATAPIHVTNYVGTLIAHQIMENGGAPITKVTGGIPLDIKDELTNNGAVTHESLSRSFNSTEWVVANAPKGEVIKVSTPGRAISNHSNYYKPTDDATSPILTEKADQKVYAFGISEGESVSVEFDLRNAFANSKLPTKPVKMVRTITLHETLLKSGKAAFITSDNASQGAIYIEAPPSTPNPGDDYNTFYKQDTSSRVIETIRFYDASGNEMKATQIFADDIKSRNLSDHLTADSIKAAMESYPKIDAYKTKWDELTNDRQVFGDGTDWQIIAFDRKEVVGLGKSANDGLKDSPTLWGYGNSFEDDGSRLEYMASNFSKIITRPGDMSKDPLLGTMDSWARIMVVGLPGGTVHVPELPSAPTPKPVPELPAEPVPPVKPEVPIGPTSIVKSVSVDGGETFVSAEAQENAADLGKATTWTWKLDVTLPNATKFDSIKINDFLERHVTAEEVRVLDIDGQDITSEFTSIGGSLDPLMGMSLEIDAKDTAIKRFNGMSKDGQVRFTVLISSKVNPKNPRLSLNRVGSSVIIPNQARLSYNGVTTGVIPSNTPTVVTSNLSHVKFKAENTVSNAEKRVSDLNEKNVDRNNLGLTDRSQKYTINFDTGDGSVFSKLKVTDKLPEGFTSAANQVSITNSAGKDITNLFTIALNGRNLTATLKEEHEASSDLVSTKVSLAVLGTAQRWLGGAIKNTATIESSDNTIKTNETVTVIPNSGAIVKEVSVDGGKTFIPASSPEEAARLASIKDNYIWRVTVSLPSHTDFTKVELEDIFAGAQKDAYETLQITDENGESVKGLGKLERMTAELGVKDSGGYKWVAGPDYLKKVNDAHGKERGTTPKLIMTMETNAYMAESIDATQYATSDRLFVIPNVARMMMQDDSGVMTDYLLGSNKSHISVPAKVYSDEPKTDGTHLRPTKLVNDSDERTQDSNRLDLGETSQVYEIIAHTSPGHTIEHLSFGDQLPPQFKTSLDRTSVVTSSGDDVTELFNLTLTQANLLTATLKDEHKSDRRIMNTEVSLRVAGDFPLGLGAVVTNRATVDDALTKEHVGTDLYETNEVKTYIPSAPSATKSVSIDGGSSFVEVGELVKRSDDYMWKTDYKLANLTQYAEIILSDTLENVQEVDQESIKVFDYQGRDVTEQGKLSAKIGENGKHVVSWSASKELVESTNKAFGKDSKDAPRFSMTIATNVREAKNADEAKLFDQGAGRVVIPNVASLKIKSVTGGTASAESNVSRVSLPIPGQASAKKFVAKDGDKPQWSDKLQLSNFDEVYQYRTEFKLADNFNFDEGGLVLTDVYEGLQSYDKVLVTDASGADISAKFDITEIKTPGSAGKVMIKATPKRANDFDDKGEVINMVIKGARLTGSTPEQLLNYLSTKDSEGGFHSGVTVPNLSKSELNSPIPGYSQSRESNKTYVNFDLVGSVTKSAEDELATVINPKDATEQTPLSELVAAAQNLISNPGKAKKASLEKLQAALVKGDVSTQVLLTLLIEASK